MKKAFEIILIIVGIILGSVARINTTLTPQRVIVSTNEDVKVEIWDGAKFVSSIDLNGYEFLPVHQDNGVFYFSPTLSMDDLVSDARASENYWFNNFSYRINKSVDNCYLTVGLVAEGEDAIKDSIRLMVQYGKDIYVVKPGETVDTNIPLDTTKKALNWLTLEDKFNEKENEIKRYEAAIANVETMEKKIPKELWAMLHEKFIQGKTYEYMGIKYGYSNNGMWHWLKRETERFL